MSHGNTLGFAIENFLSQYTKYSRAAYGSVLNNLQTKFLAPDRELSTIEPINLVQYMAFTDKREDIKSDSTYNKYVQTLRTFFNWCVKMELIASSPASVLKNRALRGSVPVGKAMPQGVLSRLIEYATDYEKVQRDARPLALIRFLSDTGCRIGGAADLTRDRLNLTEPITIDGATIYNAYLFEKGRKEPNIYYFSEETAQAIRRCLLQHNGMIVFSSEGQRILANNLASYFRRFGKKADCGSWGPHSLRHAKGHQLSQNFPLSVASRLLNNTEKTFIKYYAPKEDKYLQEAAAHLLSQPTRKQSIIQLNSGTG